MLDRQSPVLCRDSFRVGRMLYGEARGASALLEGKTGE
jgi:hypothetical protein